MVWHRLCSATALAPVTLVSGQAFRWRARDEQQLEWRCALGQGVYTLQWRGEDVLFSVENAEGGADAHRATLEDYFRLGADLEALAREWRGRDEAFPEHVQGLRQLRQGVLWLLAFAGRWMALIFSRRSV